MSRSVPLLGRTHYRRVGRGDGRWNDKRGSEIKLMLEKRVSVSARILGVIRLTVRHFIETRKLRFESMITG